MTYIIAEKPGEENAVIHLDNREDAESLVKSITDQIKKVMNVEHLKITRKEDDVIVKWQGNLMVKMQIREDDEVDASGLTQS